MPADPGVGSTDQTAVAMLAALCCRHTVPPLYPISCFNQLKLGLRASRGAGRSPRATSFISSNSDRRVWTFEFSARRPGAAAGRISHTDGRHL